jgi:5-methylcytosine-specific restriction endonuclease McrA
LANQRETFNGGQWTRGRYNAFITAVLRSGVRRWAPKYETLNAAKTEKKVNSKTGRLAQHYRCNNCLQEFTQKDVEVDHINPVVDPDLGFTSWDDFIDRLYCEADNLQVLCKACHSEKSKQEKTKRKTKK